MIMENKSMQACYSSILMILIDNVFTNILNESLLTLLRTLNLVTVLGDLRWMTSYDVDWIWVALHLVSDDVLIASTDMWTMSVTCWCLAWWPVMMHLTRQMIRYWRWMMYRHVVDDTPWPLLTTLGHLFIFVLPFDSQLLVFPKKGSSLTPSEGSLLHVESL